MTALSRLPGMSDPKGTGASRRARALLWLYTVVVLAGLGALIAMQRRVISADLKPFAVLATIAGIVGSFVTFRRGATESRQELERQERQTMLLILSAELGKQDDPVLEKLSRQKGMAGEAASWILSERLRKREGAPSPERRPPPTEA